MDPNCRSLSTEEVAGREGGTALAGHGEDMAVTQDKHGGESGGAGLWWIT
jgi:hypothetical protein